MAEKELAGSGGHIKENRASIISITRISHFDITDISNYSVGR